MIRFTSKFLFLTSLWSGVSGFPSSCGAQDDESFRQNPEAEVSVPMFTVPMTQTPTGPEEWEAFYARFYSRHTYYDVFDLAVGKDFKSGNFKFHYIQQESFRRGINEAPFFSRFKSMSTPWFAGFIAEKNILRVNWPHKDKKEGHDNPLGLLDFEVTYLTPQENGKIVDIATLTPNILNAFLSYTDALNPVEALDKVRAHDFRSGPYKFHFADQESYLLGCMYYPEYLEGKSLARPIPIKISPQENAFFVKWLAEATKTSPAPTEVAMKFEYSFYTPNGK